MYQLKTDFLADNIVMHTDDYNRFLAAAFEVANHVVGINLEDFSENFYSRIKETTSSGEPLTYGFYIDFEKRDENLQYHFASIDYIYSYNQDNELVFKSSNFYCFQDNYRCEPSPQMGVSCDYTKINFVDDFKIYSYEVGYRHFIRHFINVDDYDDGLENDAVSTLDYQFTVINNKVDLNLSYNYGQRYTHPELAFILYKENLNIDDMNKHKAFYEVLLKANHQELISPLFPEFVTENLTDVNSFKQVYFDFVDNFDEKLVREKMHVIEMARF